MKRFIQLFWLFSSLFLTFFFSSIVNAATITFSADTTLVVNNITMTIASGSVADALSTGTTTFTVMTPANGSFTVRQANRYMFANNGGLQTGCFGSETSQLVVPPNTTVIITPGNDLKVCPESVVGTAVVGGGGGGGGGGNTSGQTTSGQGGQGSGPQTGDIPEDQSFFQLPEKLVTKSVVVRQKHVKFPSSGRVTQKVFMKNSGTTATYILPFSASVKTVSGKPYIGLVSTPEPVSLNELPVALPALVNFIEAVHIQYEENVKLSKPFQLQMVLPKKSSGKFQFYYYDSSRGIWKSAGKTILSQNGRKVYVNTKRYGLFVLVKKQ